MKWRQEESGAIGLLFRSVVAALSLLGIANAYGADLSSPSARIISASDKFDGVTEIAAAFAVSDWSLLRSHHIELALGQISSAGGNAAFASIGPVWRTRIAYSRFYFDFGISPTLLNRSTFAGRDLGGNFHFTSFASAGMQFDRTTSISLRIQHTSNGGISSTNPGMDMLGLEFSFNFSD